MSQFNADDSDCIIEERNITCITIDDSQEIACLSESGEDEELPPPPPALDQEMEEGEVSDDEKDNMQKETICELKFPKKSLYEEYGKLIIDTIKEGLSAKMPGKCIEITQQVIEECITLMVQKVVAKNVEDIPMPPSLKVDTNRENRGEAFEKELSPDLSGISELFTIDTAPAPKIDSVKVPSYKRAIKDALLDGEAAARKKQKEEEEVFKTKKTNSCFNCGDTGHSIRDCTKPHNAKRIKNAKRACFKVERYHVDIEQRFAHLKPGCISDKLREALGLRRGELPFFFYRMRVLGYPPGWLEEAKVEHSGINLFNSDGTKILHSDEDEGEVDAVNHKYNISKIYDFPGFNQDPGENFFDDYKYHNVPPLSKHQMKDEFVKTMGDHVLKGYKRKKLKDFPNASAEDNITETSVQEACDMEIEDPEKTTLGEVQFSRPPPPADNPPSVSPPPPPPPSESPTIEIDCQENDISLRELEKQKQQLLKELNSNTSVIEIEDSLIDDIIELDEEDDKRTQDKTNVQTKSDNSSESTPIDENRKPTSQTTVIKESFEGTPVLKFSPYDNLPNGEKFKVGVSDVINFENLPDSTGKYEQMKQVLKKVRTCVSKLHSEE
ncbi:zinc finger CCHC domain-containing protein 8 homolog [Lucilia cuprina]|uniref:zinc finger CCHC domain-containing protein 8 homolog n=1 Tax=Lucilia cuprina TaxID=7375 RepID=UPI001F05F7C0|nr:zinc finger CCHC domain-containing protein 8 homolog [Lucilia cuprina]